eukprot:scaffold96144_cov17-Tisochrysis_lutea.AAC.2
MPLTQTDYGSNICHLISVEKVQDSYSRAQALPAAGSPLARAPASALPFVVVVAVPLGLRANRTQHAPAHPPHPAAKALTGSEEWL